MSSVHLDPDEQTEQIENSTNQSDLNIFNLPDGFEEKACRRQNGHFQQVLRFLEQRRGYTLHSFIRDCIHYDEVENLSNTTRRRRHILSAVSHPSSRRLLNAAADTKKTFTLITTSDSLGYDTGKLVSNELTWLVGEHPFGKWSSNIEETFETLDISKSTSEIKRLCPNWYGLLKLIATNQRSDRQSYNQKRSEPVERLIYMFTSMIMLQKASQRASFACTQIGMFLRSTGTKDRTIDVLSRFGICPTTDTLRKKEGHVKRTAIV